MRNGERAEKVHKIVVRYRNNPARDRQYQNVADAFADGQVRQRKFDGVRSLEKIDPEVYIKVNETYFGPVLRP